MSKIILPLTLQAIRRAQASISQTNPRAELRDGGCPGLALRIGPTSAKWSVVVSTPGRRVRVPLGEWPHIGIPDARQRAAQARDEAASYPGSSQALSISSTPRSLTDILGQYSHEAKNLKSWEDASLCIRHVFRELLSVPANKLAPRDFQRIVDCHGARFSAAKAVRSVKPILKWARKRGYVQPTFIESDLDRPRNLETTRHRVLSEDELRAVLRALTYVGFDLGARFILATGARRNEVCGATWDEIDDDLWTIPAQRRKNNKPLTIPLSTYATGILAHASQDFTESSHELVFHTQRGARLNSWTMWQKRTHEHSATSGWHRHDLRRTVATIAGNQGVAPHVVEILLGHADPHSRLASVYNKSRYLPEHRDALEQVGEYLKSLEQGSVVTV